MNAKDLVEILSEVHDDCYISYNVHSIRISYWMNLFEMSYSINVFDLASKKIVVKCRLMGGNGNYSTIKFDGEVWTDEDRRNIE